MPEYELTQTDLRDSELFLTQFMSEAVPEANFEVGSAIRDFAVKGFAYLYAFLRGEIDRVTARQSLLRMQEEGLDDSDDISQIVDEILSNWFTVRKDGEYVRTSVRFHFTQKVAQSIPVSSRFWRTNALVFYIDSDSESHIVSEKQLLPVFDNKGNLLDYVVDIPMRAARVGTDYRVAPGKFVNNQVPGGLPYFSYAENVEPAGGGSDPETSEELVARAETSLSTRNLINNRSCDATLQQQFPSIEETLTIGMGETEQIRDRRSEIGRHLQIHIGGHYDTYISLPLTTVEENLTVGGYFVRPDGLQNVFRDPQLTYDLGQTFLTVLGIQPGHILYVRSGIKGSPRGYLITTVTEHEIHVSENTSFTEASDERDAADNNVGYSIGWFAPDYSEIEFTPGVYQRVAAPSTSPTYENVPWGTSSRLQDAGKVILSGKPLQGVVWVEITDPDGGDPLIDPTTGTIIFNERVNTIPIVSPEPMYTQYRVETYNYPNAQSMFAINAITVGYSTDLGIYDGKNLRVTYLTLENFSQVHDYVNDRNIRVTAANHLIKVRNPVWVEVNIPYRLKPTASGTLDEEAAAITVAKTINEFDPNDDLDVSDLATSLRFDYDVIGTVFPLEVYYHLDSPDGQQVYFSTTDIVSIFIKDSNSVVLENGADIIPPQEMQNRGIESINTAQDLADYFLLLGVSDRTVRYRSMDSFITFERRS